MPKGAEQVNTQRTLTKKPADPTPPHEPRQRTITKEAGRGTEGAAGQKW